VNPLGNPQKMLKQIQQAQERLQRELSDLRLEATAGGGMVTVQMDGQKQLLAVKIDPEVLSGSDVDMLQDLIVAAVNEAARKVDAAVQEKVGSLAGGMGLPGMG